MRIELTSSEPQSDILTVELQTPCFCRNEWNRTTDFCFGDRHFHP